MAEQHDVVVVGGGLAGISAALRLADCGRSVTLVEGRPRLGGAAFSFRRGELWVDNGQHVFLRCCEAYRWLLRRVGALDQTTLQDHLDIPVLRPDGRRARLSRLPGVPAPAHLGAALARYGLLSPADRMRAARGALALRRLDPLDPALDAHTLGGYLRRHGQNDATIEALWGIVATATLNLRPDEASLALAAKVFRTGLLDSAPASDIGYATAPLGALHSQAAGDALRAAGVQVLLGTRVRAVEAGGVVHVPDVSGPGGWQADAVVLAVPHRDAFAIAPELSGTAAAPARGLGATPIVNVHVIYDRAVTDLPFAAAVGSPVQWFFDRTAGSEVRASRPGAQYLAVTVSAADDLVDVPSAAIRERFVAELARLLPAAGRAEVLDAFVTRERRATFRQAAGQAALRPAADSGLESIWLAGAWTATGWPDTMESAVRSGIRAAEAVGRVCPHDTLRFAA
ncbi:hydroxysqualene dehydroxylase HpnE [Jatrophihabitans cynanchi]|jgi:squalene-associated FAD-dependent desaturase|uniref:Hydroxysqualene dehydroxylase HpnE n=1 Tax=Jatrophihabitans cynanchi TaxID=2944128 RepID=A0ABY7JZG2_9ACTN|nr:hydroxysqualene dehydroxylase HpnE [Jatrophihabitans sp. SB3-54]WAX57350.1 hydroxysqualene dehydroxylase HpnE [Jatrophihabitans sp. SB3-54]